MIYRAIFVIIAILGTSFLGAKDRSRDRIDSLRSAIEKVITSTGANVNIGIEAVSLKTGEILYERNAKNLFVPGSTTKIFICGAALYELGPEYTFETKVYTDEKGSLYLVGAGDPSLDQEALEELALSISLGKKKEFADLVIDQSLFDTIVNGPGWMWDEGNYYWNSPIDALLVDHSCVDLWVIPTEAKKPPQVLLRSGNDYVIVENMALTCEGHGELDVRRSPFARENRIEVRGAIAYDTPPMHFRMPVEAPHHYTAHLFKQKLCEHQLACKGGIHLGKLPPDAVLLASHRSPPLAVLVRKAFKESDNLTANCLFKKLGQAHEGTQGTWQNGSKAVRDFLEEKAHLDINELIMLDGDGESRYNLASPHQMTQFLTWVYGQFSIAPEFLSALPLNGCDGALKNRLKHEGACKKLRAKTGSMTGITSLAGYIETADGELIALTIMVNGFTKRAAEIKDQVEDKICEQFVNFTRR